ncbi:hypothetical protein [Phenylobacterium sp.]|uniref:hypothetical protein n=1 Tax=Phenylobacterium sp. TaxID=1871053 RepID=UPI00271782EA|nr:hypothetical protein [Phenylobacterium sp.]MDO8800084.1 hypothetical protein [Phenylobacterium sp.]
MKPDTQAVFPGDLHADFTRALPGGKLDDATYEAIESALDRADAPCQAPDGRWLTLAERVARLSAESFKSGMLKAMATLHYASAQHYADAVASKKVVESEGHTFAARILQSYANGLEMDAERLP